MIEKNIVNKYKIREQNEALILKNIINHKNISRAELSSLTGLNKASVSSITKSLMDDQLIVETGIGSGSTQGGRKPILLQFNPKAATMLAFDIGTDYIDGVLAYLDGEKIASFKEKRLEVTSENVLSLLESMVIKLTQHSKYAIAGMCVGIHGVVHNNQIIFTPHYDLDVVDLYEKLTEKYDYPIFIENEANLAALGEYVFALDSTSLVSISIHSGIGAGIVNHGILQKGISGEAGEIGHSILYPNGKACPCGNHGCLEQYTSNTILYKTIAENKQINDVDSTTIKQLIDTNDLETVKELEHNAFLLSIGINNIITIYDPEVVIINSSVYRQAPFLLPKINSYLTSQFAKKVKIQNSSLGSQAAILGGIALCCQHFLNITELKLTSIDGE